MMMLLSNPAKNSSNGKSTQRNATQEEQRNA